MRTSIIAAGQGFGVTAVEVMAADLIVEQSEWKLYCSVLIINF